MGRSSSTGYPFLVQRADAGQFTYHREVSAAFASLVIGEVKLLWAGRTRVLEGKSTIKISLGTGDEKTARQRWGAVHAQVDPLIQMAEVRARGREKPQRPSDVPRLDPAHLRRIAEQAYHDVLARDDQSQIEPSFSSPLAGILMQLTQGALPAGPYHTAIAELAARKVEQRTHHGRIRRRTTWLLDRPIQESEVESDVLATFPTDLDIGDRTGSRWLPASD